MKHEKRKYTKAPRDVGKALESGPEVPWSEIQQMLELPSPDELAASLRTRKTSISLTEYSIERFKEIAEREQVPYQQLIREVVHRYAQHYRDTDAV